MLQANIRLDDLTTQTKSQTQPWFEFLKLISG